MCELFSFTLCTNVDPEYGTRRVVRPIRQSGINSPGGIETRLEGRDDYVIWGFDVHSTLEPSDRASEADGGVECLRVSDVPEDP